MARYIDVEALKNDGHPCWHDGEGNIYYEVDHAPTADVVKVKRGEWQRQKNGFYLVCSVCGKAAATKGNYCHSCGAKMDKENAQ